MSARRLRGYMAPAATRADTNQSGEVETGESNEQVLKQTDESWVWRLGGRERALILCSTNTPHFLVSSQGQTSKSRRKNTQCLSSFLFPPLCVSCRANTRARSLNNPRGSELIKRQTFLHLEGEYIYFCTFSVYFFIS